MASTWLTYLGGGGGGPGGSAPKPRPPGRAAAELEEPGGEQPGRLIAAEPSPRPRPSLDPAAASKRTSRPRRARGRRYPMQARSTSPHPLWSRPCSCLRPCRGVPTFGGRAPPRPRRSRCCPHLLTAIRYLIYRAPGLAAGAPEHLVRHLGPRPCDRADAALWEEAGARVEQHREAFGITDACQLLGRRPQWHDGAYTANQRAGDRGL